MDLTRLCPIEHEVSSGEKKAYKKGVCVYDDLNKKVIYSDSELFYTFQTLESLQELIELGYSIEYKPQNCQQVPPKVHQDFLRSALLGGYNNHNQD